MLPRHASPLPMVTFALVAAAVCTTTLMAILGGTTFILVAFWQTFAWAGRFGIPSSSTLQSIDYVSPTVWHSAWLGGSLVCVIGTLCILATAMLTFCVLYYQIAKVNRARQVRAGEKLARKILDRVLYADVAGEIEKFAGFRNTRSQARAAVTHDYK